MAQESAPECLFGRGGGGRSSFRKGLPFSMVCSFCQLAKTFSNEKVQWKWKSYYCKRRTECCKSCESKDDLDFRNDKRSDYNVKFVRHFVKIVKSAISKTLIIRSKQAVLITLAPYKQWLTRPEYWDASWPIRLLHSLLRQRTSLGSKSRINIEDLVSTWSCLCLKTWGLENLS